MGKNFFTADHHFGHARILELTQSRPFSSVEDMNHAFVEAWNQKVPPEATVFHLGDFAMGKLVDTLPLAGQLNGTKILIAGNHDRVSEMYYHRSAAKKHSWRLEYLRYFSEIHHSMTLHICGIPCLLHHLPFTGDHTEEERFAKFRPHPSEGFALLHGHIHDAWFVRKEEGLPVMINVGVDMADHFAPWSEEELEKWLQD